MKTPWSHAWFTSDTRELRHPCIVPPKKPAKKAVPKGKLSQKAAKKDDDFLVAFIALLKKKKVPVPKGLADAPPVAYADQPASFVEQMERLPNTELKRYAERIAGYTSRLAERAKREWDGSPLIVELRRRKLKEPSVPERPAGISVSLAKPLSDWSDREILHAAERWSKLAR